MSDFYLFEPQPCDAFAFEDAVEEFDPNVLPIVGPAGPQGPQGPAGPAGGVASVDGKTGVVTVLPAGGTQGQVLKKASGTDYDVLWDDESGGGGGTSDYDDLTDKPQINGHELAGNKSASDLELYGAGNPPPYPVASLLDVYPVGSIYMSVSSTSPAALFGGTWEQLKDRFLLGAGDTYTAGDTGGEATHTLTVDEMPSHTHKSQGYWQSNDSGGKTNIARNKVSTDPVDTNALLNTGGDQPHNNMPPYLVVYMWKRVA